ncbi:MAG TPA: fibronectin type III domain-containing protein [Candidatus Sumerlaeota bacterium]|nr:fibronectin type III domain-containing protein [Candidatus Sumerlaeota bacterium]
MSNVKTGSVKEALLRPISVLLLAAAGWSLSAAPGLAVNSEAIKDDTYENLGEGQFESVALSSDGFVRPAFAREQLGESGTPIIWDAVTEAGGTVLAATGHEGRLVRILDETTSETVAQVAEPELTSLLRLQDGTVLAAAAPSGHIYRLAKDDTLTTYAAVEAKFIWRMVEGPNGDVFVATGAEGKLFRLRPSGATADVREIHDFKSANLLDLWIDRDGLMGQAGALYIGGQDPGWLYRYLPEADQVEVVFNPRAEEIRAVRPYARGLALAVNTERAPTPQAMNLTMRMAGAPPAGPAPGAPQMPGDVSQALAEALSPARQPDYGTPRSEVVLLQRDGFSRTLWNAPERPIHDLAVSPDGEGVLAAAGGNGRLFEVRDDGEYAIVADLRDDYIVRLAESGEQLLMTTARNGTVWAIHDGAAADAAYISRPLDAGALVRWGHLYWHGEIPAGQSVRVMTRLGNDGDPESDLWGAWSEAREVSPGQALELPGGPARFLQYKVQFGKPGRGGESARMDYVEVFYIEPNAAPRITQLTVTPAGGQQPGRPSQPPQRPGQPPQPPQPGGPGGSGMPPGQAQPSAGGVEERSNAMTINIQWQAEDPNEDTLRYHLYYRAADEAEWKLIDDELDVNQLAIGVGGIADGRYRFKVRATDQFDNPPGEGLMAEEISDEIVIDNTRPEFENLQAEVDGLKATITFRLRDELSLISSVKVDIDNGDSYPLLPVDGMADELSEEYRFVTPALDPGEHVATFNATDREGNTQVRKIIFNVRR